MSQAAVFITCQMPDKSGLPSGVRPRAPLAWLVAGGRPATANGASQRRVATNMIAPMNQFLTLISLRYCSDGPWPLVESAPLRARFWHLQQRVAPMPAVERPPHF